MKNIFATIVSVAIQGTILFTEAFFKFYDESGESINFVTLLKEPLSNG